MMKKDMVVGARHGIGKILFFVIPLIKNLLIVRENPQVIISVPKFELCIQTASSLSHMSQTPNKCESSPSPTT